MAAVRGYEEKDPAVVGSLRSGYPRFLVHPFSRRLASALAESARALGPDALARLLAPDGGRAARAPPGAPVPRRRRALRVRRRARRHPPAVARAPPSARSSTSSTWGGSSRRARPRTASPRRGSAPLPAAEAYFRGDAAGEVRAVLRPLFAGAADGDLLLANCGMNAVYSAFRAVADLQARRGRTALGAARLALPRHDRDPEEVHGIGAADYIHLPDVMDQGALERLFADRGPGIAGVVAEVPTNPLMQTPDVAALASLCRANGVRLILDPSLASAFSVNCLPHADLVVNSLTKYTGSDGDIMAGLVAVNPASPDAGTLRREVAARSSRPTRATWRASRRRYGNTREVLSRIEESTPKVASFLASHPAVRATYWALGSRRARQLPSGGEVARRDRRDDLVHAARPARGLLRPAAAAQGPELRHAHHAHLPVHVPGPLRPGDVRGRARRARRRTAWTRTCSGSASGRSRRATSSARWTRRSGAPERPGAGRPRGARAGQAHEPGPRAGPRRPPGPPQARSRSRRARGDRGRRAGSPAGARSPSRRRR